MMKVKKTVTLFTFISMIVVIVSCNQKPTFDPLYNLHSVNNGLIGITIPDNAAGVFIANKLYLDEGLVMDFTVGKAYAYLYSSPDMSPYLDMGDVKCNGVSLNHFADNTYSYNAFDVIEPGIDFSSGASWVVSGAGAVPPFAFDAGQMPSNPIILDSTIVIRRDTTYTVRIFPVSNSDTTFFTIYDGLGAITKGKPASATSCTFTSAELGSLRASSRATVQVNTYKRLGVNILGPVKVYFIKNSVYSKPDSRIE